MATMALRRFHCQPHLVHLLLPSQPAGNPETNPDKLGAFGSATVGEPASKRRATGGSSSTVRSEAAESIDRAARVAKPTITIVQRPTKLFHFGKCRVPRNRRRGSKKRSRWHIGAGSKEKRRLLPFAKLPSKLWPLESEFGAFEPKLGPLEALVLVASVVTMAVVHASIVHAVVRLVHCTEGA